MTIVAIDALTSLKEEHYHHIGEIIYRFSLLDFQIVEALGLILGLNKKQRRLAYVSSDFKGKLTILKTVASKWIMDGALRDEINDLVAHSYELEQRRNLYAHSLFGCVSTKPNEVRIIHMRTGEQRHLPATEKYDAARSKEERRAYRDANARAQAIIAVLDAEKDNPKFVKLTLRQPDPVFPKTP